MTSRAQNIKQTKKKKTQNKRGKNKTGHGVGSTDKAEWVVRAPEQSAPEAHRAPEMSCSENKRTPKENAQETREHQVSSGSLCNEVRRRPSPLAARLRDSGEPTAPGKAAPPTLPWHSDQPASDPAAVPKTTQRGCVTCLMAHSQWVTNPNPNLGLSNPGSLLFPLSHAASNKCPLESII